MSEFSPIEFSHGPSDDDTDESINLAEYGPWKVAVDPTSLIALWPRRDAPTLEEIRTIFSKAIGAAFEVVARPPAPEPEMKWFAALQTPALLAPLAVWVEPMRPFPAETLTALDAHKVKWTVGIETVLDPRDALNEYLRLLRMLGTGITKSSAILCANFGNWFVRKELDKVILRQDVEPSADLLWVVHGTCVSEKPQPGEPMWIFTEGLRRCGVPELEMIDVPLERANAAIGLLNSIGHLLLEQGVPEPGDVMEVGPGLRLSLQPWQEITRNIGDGHVGCVGHREHIGRGTGDGARAVVCAVEPVGAFTKQWVWPQDVLTQIEKGDAAVYCTKRWTQRQTKLAGLTWAELGDAFAVASPLLGNGEEASNKAAFLLKAAFVRTDAAVNDPDPDLEHLWFKAMRFDGDRVEVKLIMQPHSISSINKDDVRWLGRDQITDWQVVTRLGTFGPGRADDMRLAIDAMVQEQVAK